MSRCKSWPVLLRRCTVGRSLTTRGLLHRPPLSSFVLLLQQLFLGSAAARVGKLGLSPYQQIQRAGSRSWQILVVSPIVEPCHSTSYACRLIQPCLLILSLVPGDSWFPFLVEYIGNPGSTSRVYVVSSFIEDYYGQFLEVTTMEYHLFRSRIWYAQNPELQNNWVHNCKFAAVKLSPALAGSNMLWLGMVEVTSQLRSGMQWLVLSTTIIQRRKGPQYRYIYIYQYTSIYGQDMVNIYFMTVNITKLWFAALFSKV